MFEGVRVLDHNSGFGPSETDGTRRSGNAVAVGVGRGFKFRLVTEAAFEVGEGMIRLKTPGLVSAFALINITSS